MAGVSEETASKQGMPKGGPPAEGGSREGGLDAPSRLPLRWRDADFHDPAALDAELRRVFDICHGCRRCVNLCNAFPTLFDLVDASPTLEVDGVESADFPKVAAECYLCDLCYMTKCPYVPPHEWAVDFPALMLRAKSAARRAGAPRRLRDRLWSAPAEVGRLAGIPVVRAAVNATLQNKTMRGVLHRRFGMHADADLPKFERGTARRRLARRAPASGAHGRAALFATCYGDRHDHAQVEDLWETLAHNEVRVELVGGGMCCGMPKLEAGDLDGLERVRARLVPRLLEAAGDDGEVVAPIPSCVLMFRQQLPLLFPDDERVRALARRMRDPSEYLVRLHARGALRTDFKTGLGKVAYHAACHTRVQNVGLKTRDLLKLIPDTTVAVVERCSGHDGTYAWRAESRAAAVKIGRGAARRIAADADFFTGDCVLAGRHLAALADPPRRWRHPASLLKIAYGLAEA